MLHRPWLRNGIKWNDVAGLKLKLRCLAVTAAAFNILTQRFSSHCSDRRVWVTHVSCESFTQEAAEDKDTRVHLLTLNGDINPTFVFSNISIKRSFHPSFAGPEQIWNTLKRILTGKFHAAKTPFLETKKILWRKNVWFFVLQEKLFNPEFLNSKTRLFLFYLQKICQCSQSFGLLSAFAVLLQHFHPDFWASDQRRRNESGHCSDGKWSAAPRCKLCTTADRVQAVIGLLVSRLLLVTVPPGVVTNSGKAAFLGLKVPLLFLECGVFLFSLHENLQQHPQLWLKLWEMLVCCHLQAPL